MARIFLSAACSINSVLALCSVHWALRAIVELFHCCWENLDPFLLFVFILGNKHAGIFCRCVSSTKKNPPQHQQSVQAQKTEVEAYSENATLAFWKWPCWHFAFPLSKPLRALRGAKPGGGCWGCPVGLPVHPCSSATRQFALLDLLCPGDSSQLPLSLPSCVLFRKIQLPFQCAMMNVIQSPYLTYPWITFKYVTANQAVINLSRWVESKLIYKSTSVGIKIKFPFSTVTFWF